MGNKITMLDINVANEELRRQQNEIARLYNELERRKSAYEALERIVSMARAIKLGHPVEDLIDLRVCPCGRRPGQPHMSGCTTPLRIDERE